MIARLGPLGGNKSTGKPLIWTLFDSFRARGCQGNADPFGNLFERLLTFVVGEIFKFTEIHHSSDDVFCFLFIVPDWK